MREIIFDTETTGLDNTEYRGIEIGAVSEAAKPAALRQAKNREK